MKGSLILLQRDEHILHLLGEMVVTAGNLKTDSRDVVMLSAIHRAIEVSKGFRAMIEAKNLICAAPLVRLQLDTVLRVGAFELVDDSRDLVVEFIAGTPMGRLKDRDGKKMTDAHLVGQFAEREGLPGIRQLYKTTSGFVHFSDAHIWTFFRNTDVPNTLIFRNDQGVAELVAERIVGLVGAFRAITLTLVKYLMRWMNAQPAHAGQGR